MGDATTVGRSGEMAVRPDDPDAGGRAGCECG
jgi:hypothetical protein